jgi:hypothetical protein
MRAINATEIVIAAPPIVAWMVESIEIISNDAEISNENNRAAVTGKTSLQIHLSKTDNFIL